MDFLKINAGAYISENKLVKISSLELNKPYKVLRLKKTEHAKYGIGIIVESSNNLSFYLPKRYVNLLSQELIEKYAYSEQKNMYIKVIRRHAVGSVHETSILEFFEMEEEV